ncbi:hypothetical protein BpHYR1_043776 [Brachionus plicatilis]|uniref:Uncharacterized protein n=1 Tax=Brachionus plicatilis TaxID=10195 RepID=A0A3M7RK03_BRAPC|nr:hypothetical protein BpHYR1_043776 [Brachionus plicatilis]
MTLARNNCMNNQNDNSLFRKSIEMMRSIPIEHMIHELDWRIKYEKKENNLQCMLPSCSIFLTLK